MPSLNRWVLLVLLIITAFLALTAWSFHRAARGASAVIDTDYYRHGLRFDQTLLEQNVAASLGWRAEPALAGRRLQVRLTDQTRQPVTGARATLTLLDGSQRRELGIHETTPGTYQADLPGGLLGEQPAELLFQRDGAKLYQRLLLSVNNR